MAGRGADYSNVILSSLHRPAMFRVFCPRPQVLVSAGSVLALTILLSGCASHYDVKVDAIRNPTAIGGPVYRIAARDSYKESHDPAYATALDCVRTALSAQGMYEASDSETADVVVEIDYGVGAPRSQLQESTIPVALAQTQSALTPNPTQPSMAGPRPGEPVVPPGTSMMGTIYQRVFVYEKYLTLSAREAPESIVGHRVPTEFWRVTVTVENEDESVDNSLPLLVTAATDYIGTDTISKQRVRLPEDTPVVALASADH